MREKEPRPAGPAALLIPPLLPLQPGEAHAHAHGSWLMAHGSWPLLTRHPHQNPSDPGVGLCWSDVGAGPCIPPGPSVQLNLDKD